MTCVQIIAPAPLLTIEEARRQVRRDDNDDDAYLLDLIAVVSEALEGGDGDARRSVMPQLWELRLDAETWLPPVRFGCDDDRIDRVRRDGWARGVMPIQLLYPPFVAIESVSYRDEDGVSQTMADFEVVGSPQDAPMIIPAGGAAWPFVADGPEVIRVRYWAGYVKLGRDGLPAPDGDGNYQPAPPARLKQAALLHLAHLYEYRSAAVPVGTATTLPMGYEALVSKFRAPRL